MRSGACYYNENDKYCAEWLRNLIRAGHIAPGEVDERDIREVHPKDLAGYRQCHFFAGIGVWSYALRLAGWGDDRPVWTGSCPCQPFSAAGRGKGFADERHLWPAWFHLISVCRPPIIFGEQVASKDGLGWFDLVSADLEGAGYAVGVADLCAAGVGAPHIRQRLWFVADSRYALRERGQDEQRPTGQDEAERDKETVHDQRSRPTGLLGHPGGQGLSVCEPEALGGEGRREEGGAVKQPGGASGGSGGSFWSTAEWLWCKDGKYRPVEPGTSPLAHGAPARVGRLRAYGNCISPQVAAEFIGAFKETA